MNRRVAVYAGTRNIYGQMAAAAKSLLCHTRMDRVWFLIEDDAFPEKLPDVIRCRNISGQTWFPPDGPNYNTAWTYMSLIRLALPEILPDEKRCLWLDADTIVMQDIGELFDTDMNGNYAAMVQEPIRSRYPFKYHNAGVCLMDLDRLRDGTYRKMIGLVNREAYTALDQDMLNLFCQGEILELAPEWNDAGGITTPTEHPIIRHFAGAQREYGRALFDEYARAEWRLKE